MANKTRVFFVVLGIIISLSFSSQTMAAGPSFDCAKASTSIEKALCRFPWLGERDSRMSAAYKKIRATAAPGYKSIIKKEQRAWIKSRNKSCGKLTVLDEGEREKKGGDITTCLARSYDKRLKFLKATSTQYGKWSVFSTNGLAFARTIDLIEKVIIFEDSSETYGGANVRTSEHTTNSKILDIKVPFVTTVTENLARVGGYYKYSYQVNVVDLETGGAVSLDNVFSEQVVLEQANNSCSKLGCSKQHYTLSSLVDDLKFECNASKSIALKENIFSGFILNNKINGEVEVSIVFHNPCLSRDVKGFDPIYWKMRLDIPDGKDKSFKNIFENLTAMH